MSSFTLCEPVHETVARPVLEGRSKKTFPIPQQERVCFYKGTIWSKANGLKEA
jgi:hypothetical protein